MTADAGTSQESHDAATDPPHAIPSRPSARGSAYCTSALIIEGDIVATDWATAGAQRARINVDRVLKGSAPKTVSYAHPVGAESLGRLVDGDHVIVFGEYDAERGYILNRDEQRPHLVRDDSVTPNLMYLRNSAPPGMPTTWKPTFVASIFPEYRTVPYMKDAESRRQNGGRVSAGVSDDPQSHGAPWSLLVDEIVTAVQQQDAKCTSAGGYGDVNIERPE